MGKSQNKDIHKEKKYISTYEKIGEWENNEWVRISFCSDQILLK